jgi:hypothetical protein
MSPEWRAVPGFLGYEVSSTGEVRSYRRLNGRGLAREPHAIEQRESTKGYLVVCLREGRRKCTVAVHRLVAATFIGARPDGMHVAHVDGNKRNNRVGNLKFCTARENNLDRARHGTMPVGERHGRRRLTAEQAAGIMFWSGTSASAARHFGVSPSQVKRIRSGQSWRCLHESAPPHEVSR